MYKLYVTLTSLASIESGAKLSVSNVLKLRVLGIWQPQHHPMNCILSLCIHACMYFASILSRCHQDCD
jgi:hypothetical protein